MLPLLILQEILSFLDIKGLSCSVLISFDFKTLIIRNRFRIQYEYKTNKNALMNSIVNDDVKDAFYILDHYSININISDYEKYISRRCLSLTKRVCKVADFTLNDIIKTNKLFFINIAKDGVHIEILKYIMDFYEITTENLSLWSNHICELSDKIVKFLLNGIVLSPFVIVMMISSACAIDNLSIVKFIFKKYIHIIHPEIVIPCRLTALIAIIGLERKDPRLLRYISRHIDEKMYNINSGTIAHLHKCIDECKNPKMVTYLHKYVNKHIAQ